MEFFAKTRLMISIIKCIITVLRLMVGFIIFKQKIFTCLEVNFFKVIKLKNKLNVILNFYKAILKD